MCEAGDKLITEKLAKVYKGKKVEKGIAFPTCVSINNCCGHFSPLKEDSIELKDGDVCKMYVRFSPLCQPLRVRLAPVLRLVKEEHGSSRR